MRIVLVGASGHGKVCAEIAKLCGYDRICFLDDNRTLMECAGYPVLGVADDYEDFIDDETEFLVSIGDCVIRKRMQERIETAGGNIATLIHPNSVVSREIEIGHGSVIMAGVVVNPESVIGLGVIMNTCSSVDHDCTVGAYSHIAVGAHLCGSVKIGENCWIGAGAVVNNNRTICAGCVIGAGAVVVKDIWEVGIYVGVPAGKHK